MVDKNFKKLQFMTDTPATLKQDQVYQTWYELLDPQQGQNHAQFARLSLYSVREKASFKGFVNSGNS